MADEVQLTVEQRLDRLEQLLYTILDESLWPIIYHLPPGDPAVTPVPDVVLAFDTILTAPDPAEHGVVGASADETSQGRLTLLRFDGTSGSTLDLARPVHSMTRWGSLVLVASGSDLVMVEWDLDAGDLPIDAPLGPLYVNGYARLAVDLTSAGLTLTDVQFAVREGPEAGSVSAGIEPLAADGTQPVVLLAGFRPGEYHVEARLRADASLLATRRFRVTACWPDEVIGPPIAVTGPQQPYQLMSWDGSGAGPGYFLNRGCVPEVKHQIIDMSLNASGMAIRHGGWISIPIPY